MWTIYPVNDPEDIDTFATNAEAMNAAQRLADASSRDYVVTDGNRRFTIETTESD